MQTKGKFYLFVNMATSLPHYIQRGPANDIKVTTDPYQAAFFDTHGEALVRAGLASLSGIKQEIVVREAVRDLPLKA